MRLLLGVLSGLVVASSASAGDIHLVADVSDRIMVVDSSSVRNQNTTASITAGIIYRHPAIRGTQKVSVSVSQQEFNCRNNTFRVSKTSLYDRNTQLIGVVNDTSKWNSVPDGSAIEAVRDAACFREFNASLKGDAILETARVYWRANP